MYAVEHSGFVARPIDLMMGGQLVKSEDSFDETAALTNKPVVRDILIGGFPCCLDHLSSYSADGSHAAWITFLLILLMVPSP